MTKQDGKLALYLVAGLLLQGAYWYLGSPGPYILGDRPRTLDTAIVNIAWSLGLLFLVPLGLMAALGDSPAKAGLRLGDARFGWHITVIASAVAVVLMFFGAQDAAIQATYPWPGVWPGRSLWHLLAWAVLYALYYLSFEFFYRGFMLRTLEPRWGLTAAIWVQALASVLIHLGKPPVETLAAIPAGLLFALIAVRSRSLLWPVLLHLVIGLSTDIFSLYHQGLLFP